MRREKEILKANVIIGDQEHMTGVGASNVIHKGLVQLKSLYYLCAGITILYVNILVSWVS